MRRIVLPLLVLSQFFCTSLWFAGNAVINNVVEDVAPAMLALVTSSVQFGCIIGTLCYALLTIADRYSPSKVFFYQCDICQLKQPCHYSSAINAGRRHVIKIVNWIFSCRNIPGWNENSR